MDLFHNSISNTNIVIYLYIQKSALTLHWQMVSMIPVKWQDKEENEANNPHSTAQIPPLDDR